MSWLAMALSLSLSLSPRVIWAGHPLTIRASVPVGTQEVCTGWRYRIVQLPQNEWPQRLSCRPASLPVWTETWGDRFPFPYEGEYQACLAADQDVICTTF